MLNSVSLKLSKIYIIFVLHVLTQTRNTQKKRFYHWSYPLCEQGPVLPKRIFLKESTLIISTRAYPNIQ